MKIKIVYFSGTGNTAWVVQQLLAKLVAKGNEVVSYSCEKEGVDLYLTDDCDMLGLMFPIHSSFAPAVFEMFMRKLPKANAKPVFIISTVAYVGGDVTTYVSRTLLEKGYRVFLKADVIMGNNLHLPALCPLPVTTQQKSKALLVKAEKKIERMANRIHGQTLYAEGSNVLGQLFGSIQRYISKTFEPRVFKGFYADDQCWACGWCVANCPTLNITMDQNQVSFGEQCMLCMRCYNFCPKEAIQTTEQTKNTSKYRRYQGPESLGSRTKFR